VAKVNEKKRLNEVVKLIGPKSKKGNKKGENKKNNTKTKIIF
jgi:hypothetical protein